MNDSQSGADPFGWFEQLALGHQQFAMLMRSTRRPIPFNLRRFA
jgi:hypothetical protein